MKTLVLKDAISSSQAISLDDACVVYQRLSSYFEQGQDVVVDFSGIDLVISAFLNRAFGDLYGQFSESYVRDRLKIENIQEDDLRIFKRVIDRAKDYYQDKEKASNRLGDVFDAH